MALKIYHNPRCTKSRLTLALLEERGLKPEIIEYLNTPPSVSELSAIVKMLGVPAREIARKKDAAEAGIDLASAEENALLETMVKHPIVIERPIVVHNGKAAIGRPPENVLEIL
jgi:arsenate reductase (glutaredoxin)